MKTLSLPHLFGWALVALSFLLVCDSVTSEKLLAQEPKTAKSGFPPKVEEAIKTFQTAYLSLLAEAKHKSQLEQAEQLLAETNDNTHWTNYSAATKLLRDHREKAAVPLLLQYMLVHTQRSSRHVMIPEYIRTVEILSGRKFAVENLQAPDLAESMAPQILKWWIENEKTLAVEPDAMAEVELAVYVDNLLSEARSLGEFTRSRPERETYGVTSQTVIYNLLRKSETLQRLDGTVAPKILPLVIAASDDQPVFPYEAAWILSELAKVGEEKNIRQIAMNETQDPAIRLACWLALYRAGSTYPTSEILQLFEKETDFERRLILLVSMRWGGKDCLSTLLTAMEDSNFEVATAAACATVVFQAQEALPKIEKLLMVDRESPLYLYNALAEFKTHEARLILKRLLAVALDGGANRQHLSRLLDAFQSAWGFVSYNRPSTDDDLIVKARMGMEFAEEAIRKRERELTQTRANLESVETQVKLAEKILELRQTEYRRLSALLGDEVVTAEVVQEAKRELDQSRTEVEAKKQQWVDAQTRLDLLEDGLEIRIRN